MTHSVQLSNGPNEATSHRIPHEIINEISSNRHTDSEITLTHQYNCINRPNGPMDHKIWEFCQWEEIMKILIICHPYHIVRLTNNTDGWETMKMMGNNGRYCLLYDLWLYQLRKLIQTSKSRGKQSLTQYHKLKGPNNECYCFSNCFPCVQLILQRNNDWD